MLSATSWDHWDAGYQPLLPLCLQVMQELMQELLCFCLGLMSDMTAVSRQHSTPAQSDSA